LLSHGATVVQEPFVPAGFACHAYPSALKAWWRASAKDWLQSRVLAILFLAAGYQWARTGGTGIGSTTLEG
jgi:hypothetical protein